MSDLIDVVDFQDIIDSAHVVISVPEESTVSTDDFTDLAATVETQIECLTLLAPAIEFPALDAVDKDQDQFLPVSPTDGCLVYDDSQFLLERSPYEFYAEPIRSKYPLARTELIERLGKANWSRYQHVESQRKKEASKQTIDILVHATDDARSGFQDSGLGTSMLSKSEDTETVASTRASSSHARLPPLPSNARRGDPFMCEVCYEVIHIKRTQLWK